MDDQKRRFAIQHVFTGARKQGRDMAILTHAQKHQIQHRLTGGILWSQSQQLGGSLPGGNSGDGFALEAVNLASRNA
jgi:hypothetical protein